MASERETATRKKNKQKKTNFTFNRMDDAKGQGDSLFASRESRPLVYPRVGNSAVKQMWRGICSIHFHEIRKFVAVFLFAEERKRDEVLAPLDRKSARLDPSVTHPPSVSCWTGIILRWRKRRKLGLPDRATLTTESICRFLIITQKKLVSSFFSSFLVFNSHYYVESRGENIRHLIT